MPLFGASPEDFDEAEPPVRLPAASTAQEVAADYDMIGLSLRSHPLALLRSGPAADRLARTVPASALVRVANDSPLEVVGIVLARQRPHTASGVLFLTVEDETGSVNVIVWSRVFDRFRREAVTARMLAVRGKLQREGIVTHVIADRLEDLSELLAGLAGPDARPTRRPAFRSRDFH